jgi:hypothetical protein
MSYEGYVQCLCKNGHYDSEPDGVGFDFNPDNWFCTYCGEKLAWWNAVDLTNGDLDNAIELELISSQKNEICPCCQHEKLLNPAVYKIPK